MRIVCLGDSITRGYGVPAGRSWPDLLAGEAGLDAINAGISGDTTGGMLARFRQDVVAAGAGAVCLMGGFNDLSLGADPGTLRSAMYAMVHHASAAGIIPVICLPPPVAPFQTFWGDSVDGARAAVLYDDWRQWLAALVRDSSLRAIDFHAAFQEAMSGPDALRLDDLLCDGLHPNVRGHALMARTAAAALEGMFGARLRQAPPAG